MNVPQNPYASPADAEPELPSSTPAHADAALQTITREYSRCAPWLIALMILFSLLALLNVTSALMFLRESVGHGIAFLAIAGLYLLLAGVVWRLRTALLELSRSPTDSTLTESLLRTRMVYAFGSSLLLMAALILGAFAVLGVTSAVNWPSSFAP